MQKSKIWTLELLWWLFTAIVVVIVMLPIFVKVPNFEFKWLNVFYIAATVTFTRYIFLLKYTPTAHSIPFKIIIPCITLISLLLITDGIAEYQRMVDEEGSISFLKHLPTEDIMGMARYIKAEYMFFGVSTVICAIILPIRMIVSIYRQLNRGTV